jgi:hypothetical protein
MKTYRKIALLFFLAWGLFPALTSATPALPGGSILDDPDYDPKIPWFQSLRSSWSVSFKAGFQGFPVNDGGGNLYLASGDWMIPFQKAGILSVFIQGGLAPLSAPSMTLSQSNLLNPVIGGGLRYQLKFFPNQPLVPTASLSYDYYRLKTTNPTTSTVSAAQPAFGYGVFLNLGWLDPVTARGAYQSLGLTKFYLTAEIHHTDFQNSAVSMNSKIYLFGIRTEFE